MHRRLRKSLLTAAVLIGLGGFAARASAADAPPSTHSVRRGDTVGGIARRYGVTIESLRATNGLAPGQGIKAGDTLAIPAKGAVDTKASVANAVWSKKGVRPGVIRLVRGTETLQTRVLDRRRHLIANTLAEFSRFLRFHDGSAHPIDPRLVTLVAMVSDHFGGRDIQVVSGFRPFSPRQYTPHSNHNHGRALDFAIRGVSNETLRDFCRTFRNVGVGYYPNSSFVHLDVRATNATWTDYAGPGQPPRYHRPEEKNDADEGAGEVDGVATVDSPSGVKSGSGTTSTGGFVSDGKENGSASSRDSTGEHSVFPGR
ncbi:MAG TPA: DUF882 domain-containing protein [Polyangiaceae bacterium]|nr:DUF882 domain-containing protein [Polyangiaceae bacterium]